MNKIVKVVGEAKFLFEFVSLTSYHFGGAKLRDRQGELQAIFCTGGLTE
jgi:hypothetical protein